MALGRGVGSWSILGCASGIPRLGWLRRCWRCSRLNIRVFGGAREFAQDFRGPVAKHRMAASTVGCLLSIVEHLRMEGKVVGAMPGNRTTKKSAPYMSRRARVAGGVGISSAECLAIEAISVARVWRVAVQPGGKDGTDASATKTRSDQRQSAPLECAEMRKASCSRKRNSAWGILR